MMTNIEKLQRMMETVKDDKETVAKITKVIPKVVSAYYVFVGNDSTMEIDIITHKRVI